MRPSVTFVCQSSVCRRQIEMARPPGEQLERISNPRCTCGSEMKRVYAKPVLRGLSGEASLQFEDSVLQQRVAKGRN